MNLIERVSRAICRANNQDPDAMYGRLRFWELYTTESQAAIDAIKPEIESIERAAELAADRKAREECAEICRNLAKESMENGSSGEWCAAQVCCAGAIRKTAT